jgi:MFS transporter, putative metabolite:H+ symporter
MYELFMFNDRRSAPAFWLGTLAVVIGVLLHLPMFVMARSLHYRLAGMAMGAGMLFGTLCVIGGVAVPVLLGLGLITLYGRETRVRDLRVLEEASIQDRP